MNFMFEWQEQYLTSERSERVRYCSCHEYHKIHILYKRTDNGVFDDFPKICDHIPKISEDFPKLSRRPDERSRTFSENFRKFPKIAEDYRGRPEDASMIHQRIALIHDDRHLYARV